MGIVGMPGFPGGPGTKVSYLVVVFFLVLALNERFELKIKVFGFCYNE